MEATSLPDLLTAYHEDPRCTAAAEALGTERARLQLSGLVGSSAAFAATAITGRHRGIHVFVLNDKEEAAYFLNDLQTLRGKDEPEPLFFPAPSRGPYDPEGHHDGERVTRTEVLEELMRGRRRLTIVTHAEALAPLVVGRERMKRHTLKVKRGEQLPTDTLLEWLQETGFEAADFVYEPGQFSLRGGIVDVFSYGSDRPYRIELFGDTVESVRRFDPLDQLSVERLAEAIIVPDLQDEDAASQQPFFAQLPDSAVVWVNSTEAIADAATKALEHLQASYDRLPDQEAHARPEHLIATPDQLLGELERFRLVNWSSNEVPPADPHFSVQRSAFPFSTKPQPSFAKDFQALSADLHAKQAEGYTNLIACSNAKQSERLYTIFQDMEHEVCFTPLVLDLHEGYIDPARKLVLYTDHQVFERYHRFRLKEGFRRNSQALTLKELTQLKPGDLVVHIDHGIGVFSGLEKLDVNGKQQEAIRLLYRDEDILYVSIHSLHRVSRYTAQEGVQPKVSKLGTAAWKNLKERTKKKIKELAFDLIKLYAERKAKPGHAFPPDNYLQHELEASFIYEDTPDQEKATLDVKKDLESSTPMDRLVCGDVGFGKTEIAIRAAFKAACDGKQVAVLVPTTILALQHYKSFKERMKGLPVRVEYINRFRSPKEQKEILRDLKEGKIEILIGTHRLVSKDVVYKDLGLLIIDEEQKFGVNVKDKLKTLRATVDTLTLTATPIPRTLQFSLLGARDLSIISTPPPNRYPVQTVLQPFNEHAIKEAIEYELSRGGQVYFVHDKVKNIGHIADMVRKLCPGARVAVGHGQLEGHQLEAVMLDFIEGNTDVLVATTIVENGLDIPNANTIIINEAQNFGLSDLHQLRGRVGRSNRKAFCYLLCPSMHLLAPDARRRLQAIEQFSDLGSGIHIAMKDLDIRGAGDMLGAEQSGFINDIGMETYHRILEEAVQELKEEKFKELFKDEKGPKDSWTRDCVLETDLELLIPSSYVSETGERLALYRELDEVPDEEGLERFRSKLVDRFGAVPPQVLDLFEAIRLRWVGQRMGFEKLVVRDGKMIGTFIADQQHPFFQSEAFTWVLEALKDQPRRYRMYEKAGTLRLSVQDVKNVQQARKALAGMARVAVG